MLNEAAAAEALSAHATPDEFSGSGGYSPAAAAAAAAARKGGLAGAGRVGGGSGLFDEIRPATPHEHAEYMALVAPVFQRFVEKAMAQTMTQCASDVGAMTRYVSWDFTSPSRDALHSLLVDPVHEKLEARFAAAASARAEDTGRRRGRRRGRGGGGGDGGDGSISSYEELVSSFTETLMTRRVSEPIRELMSELVAEVSTRSPNLSDLT